MRSGEGHGITGQGKCPPQGEGFKADSPKSRKVVEKKPPLILSIE